MKPILEGTWSLESFKSLFENGAPARAPWGQATGLLTYGHGMMSAQIMKPDRAPFESGDMFAGANEENRAAFQGYLAYWGAYDVRGDQVVHHVMGCTFPNWIGVLQRRTFLRRDDLLILRTPPILLDGTTTISELTWRAVT